MCALPVISQTGNKQHRLQAADDGAAEQRMQFTGLLGTVAAVTTGSWQDSRGNLSVAPYGMAAGPHEPLG